MDNDEKTLLAMQVVDQYPALDRTLGYEQASTEMGLLLGEYVLQGELNQFEADMIGVLAILGNVATFALEENELLRGEEDGITRALE